jgi:hypothetical protein
LELAQKKFGILTGFFAVSPFTHFHLNIGCIAPLTQVLNIPRYQKLYKSLEEMKHRFATFLKNLELIEATNKKKLSYTLGINGVN